MKIRILTNATNEEYAVFDCPQCNLHGIIDRDQYEGKISIQCPKCDFHKTINLGKNKEVKKK